MGIGDSIDAITGLFNSYASKDNLERQISLATADGLIIGEEMETILSREDPWYWSPPSLGSFGR